jgi:GH25 family lysozyme M1 (1,4-beta-N-acetylmuramidase)
LWLPWLSPITQAQHFVTTYQQYQWELPPAGDFELVPPDETNQASAILTYLQAIEEGLGIKPMIYTGKPWWNRWVGDVEWASDYKLWLAAYYSPEATIHPPERFWPGDLPLGWNGNFPSGMWQFSSTMPGREWGVSSTNLDMNWRVV